MKDIFPSLRKAQSYAFDIIGKISRRNFVLIPNHTSKILIKPFRYDKMLSWSPKVLEFRLQEFKYWVGKKDEGILGLMFMLIPNQPQDFNMKFFPSCEGVVAS